MVPLFASPVFGFLYRETIETFPGAFILLSASIYLLVAVLLLIVDFGMKRVAKRMKEGEAERALTEKMMPKALQSGTKEEESKFA